MGHKHRDNEKVKRGLILEMQGDLIICKHCQEKVRKKHFNQHLVTFHSDVEKTVECQICHWKFISDLTLKNHLERIHKITDKPNRCEKCGLGYR